MIRSYDGPRRAYFTLKGERYIYDTLTSSGVKAEGERLRFFSSKRTARKAWAMMMKKYIREHVGLQLGEKPDGFFMFWRRRPILQEHGGVYAISSRQVVIPE